MTRGGSYQGVLEGRLDGAGVRVGVVAARFNARVTDTMLERCVATLREHGVAEKDVRVIRVPGAFELPQVAQRLSADPGVDAVVALGCVIRGETPHFDFVAGEAARGLMEVGRAGRVPVVFGVLTTETEAQALERADPGGHDKGREAALAALDMVRIYRELA